MKCNKLNKKGFTLIELLAVIAILAIILVIAVPRVLDIQDNAKLGVAKDEAILALKSFETCVAAETTDPYVACTDGSALPKYFDNAIDTNIEVDDTGEKITNFIYQTTNNRYCVKVSSDSGYTIPELKEKIINVKDTTSGIIKSGSCGG